MIPAAAMILPVFASLRENGLLSAWSGLFLSVFPVFVPSLSWQNARFYT
jgi:hypothetical protein